MKIYHTQTKEDFEDFKSKYDLPRSLKWENYKEDTVIILFGDYGFSVMPIEKAEKRYLGCEIVKYERDTCHEMFIERLIENHDVVNSPKHYTRGDMELIDIMEDQMTPDEFMGYLKGNVTKYNYRELDKNENEDIEKAEWYQKKLKEFVSKGKTIFSRVAKNFTKVTGYKFDDEFVKKLETGELEIVKRDGSQVNDPSEDIF